MYLKFSWLHIFWSKKVHVMLIFDEFNKASRLFSTSLQKLQSQLRLTLGSERGSPTLANILLER